MTENNPVTQEELLDTLRAAGGLLSLLALRRDQEIVKALWSDLESAGARCHEVSNRIELDWLRWTND